MSARYDRDGLYQLERQSLTSCRGLSSGMVTATYNGLASDAHQDQGPTLHRRLELDVIARIGEGDPEVEVVVGGDCNDMHATGLGPDMD